MGKKRRVPPARERYEQSHPTVSVRVSRETYDGLKELRQKGGKSLGDILREALNKQRPMIREYWNQGFQEARRRYVVTYSCKVCGKPIELVSEEAKKAAAQYMQEHGWGHRACHESARGG